jgi:CRP-like cAMP-binding protein/thioredoxin reductase/Na+-translocating ferredoxin:NAD+ oxidoreductase RNF subunit RnfB
MRVEAISGQFGNFLVSLASGERLAAESVVLAIGVQGSIRKLEVPGDNLPGVQYQLDDAEAYRDETILVIGGGDSAIENALALAARNRVILINRQDEFTKCGEANFNRLKQAVAAGAIEARTGTTVAGVESDGSGAHGLALLVQSPQGEERIGCHRIIARLGTVAPRQTLERFNIMLPGRDPAAVPQLSDHFESSVPGLYIVGALAGYPLIKHALNQGYEVVEHILGRPVVPADQPLLEEKFSRIPGRPSVMEVFAQIGRELPLFASLTKLQLRELMLDSEILTPGEGEVVFRQNDYSNSFFSVLRGSVRIYVEKPDGQTATFDLAAGSFFGEIGLLSGRRRSGTAVAGKGCVLVETPRRDMLRLLDAVPEMQRRLDEAALMRIVRNCYGASLADAQIEQLVREATLQRYRMGETVFAEGDAAGAVYLIRRGSVTVSRQVQGREVTLAYVSAGNYVGEMALVSRTPRTATVRAAAPTEMVALDAGRFIALLDENLIMRSEVAGRYLDRLRANEAVDSVRNSDLIHFLMEQGVGEATDVLLIDYSRCIRCDNCETACADVHNGTSRLRRAAGRTFAHIHVPASCRHCENPRCMKNCPPDAIHRSTQGETFIGETCIGCGNCESSCPHGVIQMANLNESYRPPGVLELLLGRGRQASARDGGNGEPAKIAVKCDMCRGIIGGAACVRACPTGAAFRVSPEQFVTMSDRQASLFS